MRPRSLSVFLLLLGAAMAQEPAKPSCHSSNRGQIWPTSDVRNPQVPIEICTVSLWKYRWVTLTVPYNQLNKESRLKSVPLAVPVPEASANATR
ncbi:MAG: hypothetical protein ABI693_17175 [Bryobacteraceae bacterium]